MTIRYQYVDNKKKITQVKHIPTVPHAIMINENYSEILKSIAHSENVLNPELSFLQATNKGDGYIGNICFVNIKGTNKNLDIALKSAPTNEQMREKAKIELLFKNEVLFYTDINRIFQKIQRDIQNPFVPPKCYRTSLKVCEEHLALENLKSAGYTMWDRRKMLDYQHVVLVLQQYAKLHALSYVLREIDVESFNFIKESVVDVWELYNKDEGNKESCRKLARKIYDVVPETFKNEEIKRNFEDLCQNFTELLKEAAILNKDTVLCHGDGWCNNMIFKYEDGKLIDMKLLDFQVIKMSNPVLDLAYFIYINTSRDIYDDIDDLLRIYHEALSDHAKNLGVKISLTLEELKNYWKLYSKTGLYLAVILIKALLADGEEDTPDIAKEMDQGGHMVDAFNYEGKHDKEYYRRLHDIVLHCHDNGFL